MSCSWGVMSGALYLGGVMTVNPFQTDHFSVEL